VLIRLLLNLLPVLIHTDEEMDVIPTTTAIPGNDIGADFFNSMPQMRFAV